MDFNFINFKSPETAAKAISKAVRRGDRAWDEWQSVIARGHDFDRAVIALVAAEADAAARAR